MPLTSRIKVCLNAVLSRFNLRLETLTAERIEAARLAALVAARHFDRPVFPVLSQFENCRPEPILAALEGLKPALERLAEDAGSGYSFQNDYFTSPDADVAYAVISHWQPGRLIEVGSGNSTFLFRAAIDNAGLDTRLISIDPAPRKHIENVADEILRQPLEQVSLQRFDELAANDVLFIDSSHRVAAGNDVLRLILEVVPKLTPGVLVHFHDVFLPFDYPMQWVVDWRWGMAEQYLLQALLQGGCEFEVLWPGRYLQHTRPELARLFDGRFCGTASSLWLRKIA